MAPPPGTLELSSHAISCGGVGVDGVGVGVEVVEGQRPLTIELAAQQVPLLSAVWPEGQEDGGDPPQTPPTIELAAQQVPLLSAV